jgi:hypothetical protein
VGERLPRKAKEDRIQKTVDRISDHESTKKQKHENFFDRIYRISWILSSLTDPPASPERVGSRWRAGPTESSEPSIYQNG